MSCGGRLGDRYNRQDAGNEGKRMAKQMQAKAVGKDTPITKEKESMDTAAKDKFLRWFYRLDIARYRLTPGQTLRERATTLKLMRQLTYRARVREWTADDVQAGRN
jgi:hypothetical protein